MKEIPEDLQWEIFELLEGNLTDEQSNLLYQKINSNADLKNYHDSLKRTYLNPYDAVVFENKKAIIKKSAWITSFSPLKYAAAALIVFCVSYLTYKNQPNPVIIQSTVVKNQIKRIPESKVTKNPELSVRVHTPTFISAVSINKQRAISIIPLEKLSLNKINKHKKRFKPSSKLFEESEFYNNLTANTYLTEAEKKQIMLKWLLIHSENYCACQDDCIQIKPTNNIALNVVDIKNDQQLSKQWISEVKEMIKHGTIPKIKLVSSRKKEKWLPSVGIQVNTENAAMVANIIN